MRAAEYQEELRKDIEMRKKKKRDIDRMRSQNDYNKALDFYHTSRIGGGFTSPDSPEAKSQMSKTQQSFWPGNHSQRVALGSDKVNEELKNYQSKIERGFHNSMMLKQMKV
jgi:hypothetical protein